MSPAPIELSSDELDALIERIKARKLLDTDYQSLEAMGETIGFLSQKVNDKNTSIKRLLQMIFGAQTEKTENIVQNAPKPKRKKKKKLQKAKVEKHIAAIRHGCGSYYFTTVPKI